MAEVDITLFTAVCALYYINSRPIRLDRDFSSLDDTRDDQGKELSFSSHHINIPSTPTHRINTLTHRINTHPSHQHPPIASTPRLN
jgi:hypothetical protein